MPASLFNVQPNQSRITFVEQIQDVFFFNIETEIAAVMKGIEQDTITLFEAKSRLLVLLYKLTNIPRGIGDFTYMRVAAPLNINTLKDFFQTNDVLFI